MSVAIKVAPNRKFGSLEGRAPARLKISAHSKTEKLFVSLGNSPSRGSPAKKSFNSSRLKLLLTPSVAAKVAPAVNSVLHASFFGGSGETPRFNPHYPTQQLFVSDAEDMSFSIFVGSEEKPKSLFVEEQVWT